MRRPRRVAEPLLLEEFQKRVQGTRLRIYAGVTVTELLEALGHGGKGEIGRIAVRDLFPRERRRDPRIGCRPYRIGGCHGAVLGVLVVIDEDALALFLPPLAG